MLREGDMTIHLLMKTIRGFFAKLYAGKREAANKPEASMTSLGGSDLTKGVKIEIGCGPVAYEGGVSA